MANSWNTNEKVNSGMFLSCSSSTLAYHWSCHQKGFGNCITTRLRQFRSQRQVVNHKSRTNTFKRMEYKNAENAYANTRWMTSKNPPHNAKGLRNYT